MISLNVIMKIKRSYKMNIPEDQSSTIYTMNERWTNSFRNFTKMVPNNDGKPLIRKKKH